MFSMIVLFLFHWDSTGFAAARMDVRAFREQMMPALAIDSVCCSYKHRFTGINGGFRKPTNWVKFGQEWRAYHNFMKHRPRAFIHLVKFINATYTIIAQNQSSPAMERNAPFEKSPSEHGGVTSLG